MPPSHTRTALWTLLAVLTLSGPAQAMERTMAIIPVHAEGVGEQTAQIAVKTLLETAAELEMAVVPEEDVLAYLTGHCDAPPCNAEETLALGQALDVSWILQMSVIQDQEEITVAMTATPIQEGDPVTTVLTTDKAGMLAAVHDAAVQVLPAVPDPCAPFDCSGHGTCVLDENQSPVCQCDEGWFTDKDTGLDCHPRSSKPKLDAKLFTAHPMDQEATGPVISTATAGIVFGALSLGTTAAAFIALCVHMEPRGQPRAGTEPERNAFHAMQSIALTTHVIGLPLMLGARMKGRRAQGIHPHNSQTIAAWSLYAVTSATMGMSFYLDLGFVFPAITLPLIISGVTVSMHEAHKSIGEARASQEAAVALLPVVSAGQDGFTVGLAGSF